MIKHSWIIMDGINILRKVEKTEAESSELEG